MKARTLSIAMPWLLLLLLALAAAWLRYGLIEPTALAHQCDGVGGPAWCRWRQWVVEGFLNYSYGYVALASAALALCWQRQWTAWLAAALGVFALLLYCYDAGALALLIGVLRLLRLQAGTVQTSTSPLDQHRQRDGEIQGQP